MRQRNVIFVLIPYFNDEREGTSSVVVISVFLEYRIFIYLLRCPIWLTRATPASFANYINCNYCCFISFVNFGLSGLFLLKVLFKNWITDRKININKKNYKEATYKIKIFFTERHKRISILKNVNNIFLFYLIKAPFLFANLMLSFYVSRADFLLLVFFLLHFNLKEVVRDFTRDVSFFRLKINFVFQLIIY